MLQDLERGRPMEIDALVTAVQEMGCLVGVQTPFIDTVLGLIQIKSSHSLAAPDRSAFWPIADVIHAEYPHSV